MKCPLCGEGRLYYLSYQKDDVIHTKRVYCRNCKNSMTLSLVPCTPLDAAAALGMFIEKMEEPGVRPGLVKQKYADIFRERYQRAIVEGDYDSLSWYGGKVKPIDRLPKRLGGKKL